MFLCGGTPCTGFAFCATPSLCDKLDNNNNTHFYHASHRDFSKTKQPIASGSAAPRLPASDIQYCG